MELSMSQRGKPSLIYLGFEYLQFRVKDEVINWRCKLSRSLYCHSNMTTKNGSVIKEPTPHCHDSCPQKIEANKARNAMKCGMKLAGSTPKNIMESVLSTVDEEILAYLPKKSSLSRHLRQQKERTNLPNPLSPDFEVPGKYQNILLYDSGISDPERILVLGDKELLLELRKSVIYGDGTFDKSASMFYQLYTWSTKVGISYPPCIYFLFVEKTANTYAKMFDIMKYLLPDWAPQIILLDFEKACINAATVAFPMAQVKGCYFHLCQTVIKKVSDSGLKTEFESNIEVKIKLKSLAAMSFVPPDAVQAVFQQLAASYPNQDSYNEVLTYFYSTFIEGAAGRAPQFPIEMWNHFEAALHKSLEVTSCCESFHNALNSIFHHNHHPSVWVLLEGLARDMSGHKIRLDKIRLGQPVVKRKMYEIMNPAVADRVLNYWNEPDKVKYLRGLANL